MLLACLDSRHRFSVLRALFRVSLRKERSLCHRSDAFHASPSPPRIPQGRQAARVLATSSGSPRSSAGTAPSTAPGRAVAGPRRTRRPAPPGHGAPRAAAAGRARPRARSRTGRSTSDFPRRSAPARRARYGVDRGRASAVAVSLPWCSGRTPSGDSCQHRHVADEVPGVHDMSRNHVAGHGDEGQFRDVQRRIGAQLVDQADDALALVAERGAMNLTDRRPIVVARNPDGHAGSSSSADTCLGRTVAKWRWSSVASFRSPSRSTTATTAASTNPRRRSTYCSISSRTRV